MNLREVCQLQGFDTAVLTSFNFDPLFFERVVLKDLRRSGCGRILVFVDAAQALPVIDAARGQIVALGREYQLFPIRMRGAFHPKALLKLNDRGGVAVCGSHNLTRPGWLGLRAKDASQGNREATAVWRIDPEQSSIDGASAFLRTLRPIASSAAASQEIDDILQRGALRNAPANGGVALLSSGPSGTLAQQLAARWAGRRFQRLRYATGSTDSRGAFLAWAAEAFGVRDAVIELDPMASAFDAKQLGKLPVSVSIVARTSTPRPHMKVVLFEGPDGDALVVGSANCSAAAWLTPLDQGGNIEAVVVMDRVEHGAAAELFDLDRAPSPVHEIRFAELIPPRDAVAPEQTLLTEVVMRGRSGVAVATLSSPPSPAEKLLLELDDGRAAAASSEDGRRWSADLGPASDGVPATLFCRAVVAASCLTTPWRWVDDLDELSGNRSRSLDASVLGQLRGDGSALSASNLLKGVLEFGQLLLAKTQEESTHAAALSKDEKGQEAETSGRRLTLEDLIRSSTDDGERVHRPSSVVSGVISLQGVLHAIFRRPEAASGSTPGDILDEEGRQRATSSGSPGSPEPPEQSGDSEDERHKSPPVSGPTAKDRLRLRRQIASFVAAIVDPAFAETATARQLQQAVAFPLGCGLLAAQGPWISTAEDRAEWGAIVRSACNALLAPRLPGAVTNGDSRSLLEYVRDRYGAHDRLREFDGIVGDGSLWLAMLAALHKAELGCTPFERMLVLELAVRAEALREAARSSDLELLAAMLSVQDQSTRWLVDAAQAAASIETLRKDLTHRFESLKWRPTMEPKQGDWLWKPGIDFARIERVLDGHLAALESPVTGLRFKRVQLGYYVNLRTAGIVTTQGDLASRQGVGRDYTDLVGRRDLKAG